MASPLPPPRPKPLLRGFSHEVAALAAAPASVALVIGAQGARATAAAATYGASLLGLFCVSALYHRPFWPPRARFVMGRLDHSAIFVLIAGTYPPICLLLGPGTGYLLLAVAWGGAAAGVAIELAWADAPKPMRAAAYVLLGWAVVPATPAVRAALGDRGLLLLAAGGLAYTAGAIVYALRRPDPFPTVFGFHEIFHLLVIAAAGCHYAAVQVAIAALA